MNKNPSPQESIPATKVQRAAKFLQTGVKVGGNYVKHYAKKLVNPELSKDGLHEDNAADVYGALSELKGSALKVAQMMSMDRNLLPRQYADRFQMAQYSAPPLSYPLVVKTFQKHFGKGPSDLLDSFSKDAVNAASIGQVHKATKNGKSLAVKIQYPGVAESVSSDLKIVKPFAVNLLGLNERDVDHYMEEVENMLLAETDYELELQRSVEISNACAHIEGIRFPTYYPELSCKKILTMDWLDGLHLDQFLASDPSQEARNRAGQALWDFYDFQIHQLRSVHADPHPGNFILSPEGLLGVIDFGCVKVIPDEFYYPYFSLIDPHLLKNDDTILETFQNLKFIYPEDSEADRQELFHIFKTMVSLLGRPFHQDVFDFGQDAYFEEIYRFGEASSTAKSLRNSRKPRGNRHGLYVNRTYFGLYSILNQLKAQVATRGHWFITHIKEQAGSF